MTDSYSGNLIIVAAPSGGGKTSLVKKLVSTVDDIEISTSHTTRKIRPGEKDGVDYFFIEEPTFSEMIKAGDFLEHALVFKHHYGTSKAQINTRLKAGIDVVLDIDWQGAQQIKRLYPEAISVFVIPPSLTVLQQRLQDRKQDNEEVISHRMQNAKDELTHFKEFDYLIINDDFDKAACELEAIVRVNRLRMTRQAVKERKLLSFLLASQ
ncbi:MAG: guanylate kinase [Tatlockia sp.]